MTYTNIPPYILLLFYRGWVTYIYPPTVVWHTLPPTKSGDSSPVSPLLSDILSGPKRGVNPPNIDIPF